MVILSLRGHTTVDAQGLQILLRELRSFLVKEKEGGKEGEEENKKGRERKSREK